MNEHKGGPEVSSAPQWHIPDHIHPLFHDGGAVILDSQSGWRVTGRRVTGRRVAKAMLEASGVLADMSLDWPEIQEGPSTMDFVERVVEEGYLLPGASANGCRIFPYATPPEGIELLEAGNQSMTRKQPEPLHLSLEQEKLVHQSVDRAAELVKSLGHGAPFVSGSPYNQHTV